MEVHIKLKKTILKFGDTEIVKHKFHQYKKHISVKNPDINKIGLLRSIRVVLKCFKYFIGYENVKKIDLYVHFYQLVDTKEIL